MKYTINVNYDTGDSFNNYPNQNETVDLQWENLDIAKENLIAIKEHYELYRAYESHSFRKSVLEELEEKYKDREWKVNEGDKWSDKYKIKLKADNGNWMQIYCFWCGYFEQLNYAEIVNYKNDVLDNTDMIIYA